MVWMCILRKILVMWKMVCLEIFNEMSSFQHHNCEFQEWEWFLAWVKWSTTVFALVTSVKSQACSCLKWIKNIAKIRLSNCQIKCLLSSPLKLHLNFTNDFCLKTLKEQSKLYFDSDKKLSFSSKLGIYIIFLASKIWELWIFQKAISGSYRYLYFKKSALFLTMLFSIWQLPVKVLPICTIKLSEFSVHVSYFSLERNSSINNAKYFTINFKLNFTKDMEWVLLSLDTVC